MGLLLSISGIGPTEEKIRAVLEDQEPQNVTEVKSFLGLVNFNARFIPDLATIAEPMRRLAKRGVPFVFGPEQQESFRELKRRLAQAENPSYFDQDAKTKIIFNASPVGLAAILMQKHNYVMLVEVSPMSKDVILKQKGRLWRWCGHMRGSMCICMEDSLNRRQTVNR